MAERSGPETPVKIKIRGLAKTFKNNGIQVSVLSSVDLDILRERPWQW